MTASESFQPQIFKGSPAEAVSGKLISSITLFETTLYGDRKPQLTTGRWPSESGPRTWCVTSEAIYFDGGPGR